MSFIITILAGIGIGFFYDFFRVTRNYGRKTAFKCSVSDILFWLTAGILTIVALYISNDMIIRVYQFLGLFFGVFIYFIIFSRFFVYIDKKILCFFGFIFKILFTIVNFFVIIVFKTLAFIFTPFKKLNRFLIRLIRNLINNFKKNWKYVKRM